MNSYSRFAVSVSLIVACILIYQGGAAASSRNDLLVSGISAFFYDGTIPPYEQDTGSEDIPGQTSNSSRVYLPHVANEGGLEVASMGTAAPSETDIVPGEYIVMLKEPSIRAEYAADGKVEPAESFAIRTVSKYGGDLLFIYDAISGFAASLPENAINDLLADPNVLTVEPNRIVQLFATQPNPTWGLDRVDQNYLPLNYSYIYNVTGSGVHAYIIDTGMRTSHNEFAGRIGGGFTSIYDGRGVQDCVGHGTHVAGTVGGTRYGIAKQVILHPVRVLDCNGEGTDAEVLAGINWVTANAVRPAVANMSLGRVTSSGSNTVDTAVQRSINSGIVYVLASGNNAINACYVSPARVASAITVGATTRSDYRSSYSNYGSCLDLFAPGDNITSASNVSNNGTATYSGTSMAAPHVTGAVALYLSVFNYASPAQVSSAIVNNSTSGVLRSIGTGSPNRLLYTGFIYPPPPAPSQVRPQNGTAVNATNGVLFYWEGRGQQYWVQILSGGSVLRESGWVTSLTWTTYFLSEGYYQWRVKARNGVIEGPWSLSLGFRVDNTAPVVAFSELADKLPVRPLTAIKGTSSDLSGGSGLAAVKILIRRSDGLYWTGSNWSGSLTWITASISGSTWATNRMPPWQSNATYQLRASSTDRAGNTALTPLITIIIDTTNPIGNIQGSIADGGYRGTGDLIGTASDNHGVSHVLVYLRRASDGRYWSGFNWSTGIVWLNTLISPTRSGNWGTTDATWRRSLGTVPWEVGAQYTVRTQTFDRAGNSSLSNPEDFIYDNVPPSSAIQNVGNYSSANSLPEVRGAAADSLSGIAQVRIFLRRTTDGSYWNGTAWQSAFVWLPTALSISQPGPFGPRSVTWRRNLSTVPYENEVAYQLRSQVWDQAGNSSMEPAIIFRIDKTAPMAAINAPRDRSTQVQVSHALGIATDSIGVSSVQVYLRRASDGRYWNGATWQTALSWLPTAIEIDSESAFGPTSVHWRRYLGLTAAGNFSLRVRVFDRAGNMRLMPTVYFALSNISTEGEQEPDGLIDGTLVDSMQLSDPNPEPTYEELWQSEDIAVELSDSSAMPVTDGLSAQESENGSLIGEDETAVTIDEGTAEITPDISGFEVGRTASAVEIFLPVISLSDENLASGTWNMIEDTTDQASESSEEVYQDSPFASDENLSWDGTIEESDAFLTYELFVPLISR